MSHSPITLLTYSKAFYNLGALARKMGTSFGNMQAVLHFHDAVEISFNALWEISGITDKQPGEFLSVFNRLNTHFGSQNPPKSLPPQAQMNFLNKIRVNVKHFASVPSHDDTEKCQLNAYSFLSGVCNVFFNLDFDSLSQIDLVESGDLQRVLKESLRQEDVGDLVGATVSIRKAFHIAQPSVSTFITHTDNWRFNRNLGGVPEMEIVHDVMQGLEDKLETIERAVANSIMGIDPLRFQRFEASTPEVVSHTNGITMYPISTEPPSLEAVQEARDFVVEMILKWQGMGVVGSRRTYDDDFLSPEELMNAQYVPLNETQADQEANE